MKNNGATQDPLGTAAEMWFAREMDRIKADPRVAQQRALDIVGSETLASEMLTDLAAIGMLANIAQDRQPFDATLLLGEYLAYVRQRFLLQGPPFKIVDKPKIVE